ncbi:MAG: phosphotransferase [Candidatus Eisenbacteria bacterium]|nr:phosphotransferase [Candidatus Eisenbacteria bacterium]
MEPWSGSPGEFRVRAGRRTGDPVVAADAGAVAGGSAVAGGARSAVDVSHLPADPALPGLAWIATGGGGAAPPACLLRRLELVKHRPGRRMVLRAVAPGAHPEAAGRPCGERDVFLKLYHNARGERLAQRHGELRRMSARGAVAFRVPPVVGFWPAARTLALGGVPGEPIAALPEADLARAAEAAGEALASLHESGWQPGRAWSLEEEVGVLVRSMGEGAAAFSHLPRALRGVEGSPVPLHRDFHPGQVLWGGPHGVAILDWDDAASGAAAIDVGNFVAHLELEALRHAERAESYRLSSRLFATAYFRARGTHPWAELPAFIASTLVRLAGIALERRGDEREAEALRGRAREVHPD